MCVNQYSDIFMSGASCDMLNLSFDFTEVRDSEWQWHQLGDMQICTLPCPRQITMPAPHYSVFFTGRIPFLPPNQWCQSTEDRM